MRHRFASIGLTAWFMFLATGMTLASEWSIPLAGNSYLASPDSGRDGLRRSGLLVWSNPEDVYSIFFHVDRPADIELSLRARAVRRSATVQISVGDQTMPVVLAGETMSNYPCGRISIDKPGYVRVDLLGVQKDAGEFGEFQDLIVKSATENLAIHYVKTNEGNMFYWGRRGPSVHLSYSVPKDLPLRYAYSEITVPEGQDPIGSYYMANGFSEGYFGIQVNGPHERRVLFSVWSPFSTDDPDSIPADQRIATLAKGEGVHVGEFGNEGSGGQSYLVYPWKSGTTYRFLTEVNPDGQGNTIYTCWFGESPSTEWRLIASFRRPKTDTSLRGFHSFLESFDPARGHLGRRANYGNVWVYDVSGQWHECTSARLSVDGTGGGGHRLDFNGGAKGTDFFLQNCGFFDETGQPGSHFTRTSTADRQPQIDWDRLPRH